MVAMVVVVKRKTHWTSDSKNVLHATESHTLYTREVHRTNLLIFFSVEYSETRGRIDQGIYTTTCYYFSDVIIIYIISILDITPVWR